MLIIVARFIVLKSDFFITKPFDRMREASKISMCIDL